ncbi:DUF4040 domain-containing protein [Clostridium sp. D2Q-14]|uniref:Na(+)/H(+) antiporter subunit B n=1 Tax=Anaeromonas gelatinilytica TaxID=2683194 RepID=UPI00193AF139|nr:DUF4040 domain-containing protein [Anaeromonas gelatinilytica]MBS4536490.1 DUF4040 domain-containing protein [Anaeromonas gelatinilytica]
MNTIIFLQTLLIIVALTVTFLKDNFRMVIFFSVFSLICSSLYFFYMAPDLALAEVTIGSAIVPLIFIIAISKQRGFVIINDLEKDDDFLSKESEKGIGYKLLSEFAELYKLNLVIEDYEDEDDTIFGVFRVRNVDLFVSKKHGKYLLEGKSTNIIMNKLAQMAKDYPEIDVVFVAEEETDD